MNPKQGLAMRVGALAAAADVRVETIRYYQEIGLMSRPKRPTKGARLYGLEDLARLRFIKGAQKMTFSLEEIKNLLQMSDGQLNKSAIRSLTEARLQQIRTLKASLEAIDQALTASMAQCAQTHEAGPCPIMQHFIASYALDDAGSLRDAHGDMAAPLSACKDVL